MKNLTRPRQDDTTYILSAEKQKPATHLLDVTFADGTVYTVDNSEENREKINIAMENQVTTGLNSLSYFKNCSLGCYVGSFASCAASIGYALPNVTATQSNIENAVGVAIVGFTVGAVALIKGLKAEGKVREIEKFRYRNAHQEELDRLRKYHNALISLKNKALKKHIEANDNPFAAIYSDLYTEKDLKTIVREIKREKTYQFTYNQVK